MSGAGIDTDVPLRLDRLPWSRFHTRVVVALGVTWLLDGLEVTVVGAVASMLERPDTLALSAAQVGVAGSSYLAGAIVGALVFGRLTDHYGRKRLFLITLALYVLATVCTSLAQGFASFIAFRALTGLAIGGEYAAINSAIDELLPARVRGHADLAINGTYWLGTVFGALATLWLLDTRWFAPDLGWRLSFALGAVLTAGVVLVRRYVPESPRWLLMHGHREEAERIVADIERDVERELGTPLSPVTGTVFVRQSGTITLRDLGALMLGRYRARAFLCATLMAAQAFFYNAIFFTYALTLTTFYEVPPASVGSYLLPFALANFFGPVVLGRFFDSHGRRPLIVGTYALSGVGLLIVGALFYMNALDALGQTIGWTCVFFFASSAASSAYLTVSELFPVEFRALAIALFYALGTALGGLVAPLLFGALIERGERSGVFFGYTIGSALMIFAALVALRHGVSAERKGLEEISPY